MKNNQRFALALAIVVGVVVICTVSVVKTGNLCFKYKNEGHYIEISTDPKGSSEVNENILDSDIEKKQQKNDK